MSKTIFFLVLGSILTLTGCFFLLAQEPNSPLNGIVPSRKVINSSDAGPIISKPVEHLETKTAKGVIVKLNNSILSAQTDKGVENFNIRKTFTFNRLVSGTVEGGDAKTTEIKFEDLKVGQEILILAEGDSNYTKSVVILNDTPI